MPVLRDISFSSTSQNDQESDEIWGSLASFFKHVSRNSPYLSRALETNQDWLLGVLQTAPEKVIQDILAEVDSSSQTSLAQTLRYAKSRISLYLALMDLGGLMPVLEVTKILSEFADFSVQTSLRFLLAQAVERKKLPPSVTSEQCGIFCLAMGKGGAYELNYSSDIDLIVFYDADRVSDDDFDVRKGFIRVVQAMVKVLSETDKDGYVFRTDLRLRPDPSVTPVVISTDQALGYYEMLGRTWERAAFIKARVCAGDFEAGEAFLREMRPFIWRKHLDFAAIEDAHNMRLRIREHKGLEGPIELVGHNLKLGKGGIREIEFFTQTRQLIFGGRNENLRLPATYDALDALAAAEVVEGELSKYLKAEYLWLRKLEHIAQMIDDQQTHLVPDGEKLEQFIALAGAKDQNDFERDFVARLQKIDETMDRFFAGQRTEETNAAADFEGIENEMIEGWMSLPALRSERARSIFTRLSPKILEKLGSSRNPVESLRSFDRFLVQLPSGVQLFSLFEANPALLDLLAEICAIAPKEARELGENHRIFDAVLSADFFEPLRGDDEDRQDFYDQLDRELKQALDYEDVLNAVRRFVREAQFRVSVHLLRDLASMDVIAKCYSFIADLALEAVYPAVLSEMERRYGKAPGRGMVVLAMGKLGSREMTRSSDLDLVMIYDAQGVEYSDGKRSLAASQYYSRFTQNFIQAINVATAEGELYEVDMRLRPSGRQGPVAVSISGFADYQLNEAWTWEHMALLRARVVAGETTLAKDVMEAAKKALSKSREKLQTARDVMEMRTKIRENFDDIKPLSLKHGAGRLMETELMLQGLALLGDEPRPGQSMLDLLDKAQQIMSSDDAGLTKKALALYSGLMQLARLSFDDEMQDPLPQTWLLRQETISAVATQGELEKKLAETADGMDQIFERYLGMKI